MKKRYIALLLIGGVIVWRGVFGEVEQTPDRPEHLPAAGSLTVASAAPQKVEAARGQVEISGLRWKGGGFDTVGIFAFTITNKTRDKVKDYRIACSLYGKSGTALGSVSKRIYEDLDPGKSRQYKDLNFGFVNSQANDARCSVDDYVKL